MAGSVLSGVASLASEIIVRIQALESCDFQTESIQASLEGIEPFIQGFSIESKFGDLHMHLMKNLIRIDQVLKEYLALRQKSWILRLYMAQHINRRITFASSQIDKVISLYTAMSVTQICNKLTSLSAAAETLEDADDDYRCIEECSASERELEITFDEAIQETFAIAVSNLSNIMVGSLTIAPKFGEEAILRDVILDSFTVFQRDIIISYRSDGFLVTFQKISAVSHPFQWSISLSSEQQEQMQNMINNYHDDDDDDMTSCELAGIGSVSMKASVSIDFKVHLESTNTVIYTVKEYHAMISSMDIDIKFGKNSFLEALILAAINSEMNMLISQANAMFNDNLSNFLIPQLNETLRNRNDHILNSFSTKVTQNIQKREASKLKQFEKERNKRREIAKTAKVNKRKAELQALRREVEELWEFERWYPVRGWVPAFAVPPMFANASRTVVVDMSAVNRLCTVFDTSTAESASPLSKPLAWFWESDWVTENWQYTVGFRLGTVYVDACNTTTFCRRRRWVRKRIISDDQAMRDLLDPKYL